MAGEKTPHSVGPPPPDAVAFSPDGVLFAAVADGRVQLIDARTSTFKSALELSTTLDYLFSEIADDETDEEEAAPPIIYEDKDTDEEESEVDAMETDGESEELGDVTDASDHSELLLPNSLRNHRDTVGARKAYDGYVAVG